MKKFIAIIGSISKLSTNRKLVQYMQKRFDGEAEIEFAEIRSLPIFRKTSVPEVSDTVQDIADRIVKSDGVIISTPEYDHAVPAVLLSALAWLSYGVHPFTDKPIMITGASHGLLGSARAQAQLRQVLDSPELKARIMPSSEFLLGHSLEAFDDEGMLKDATASRQLDGLFQDFLQFVEISEQLNNATDLNKQTATDFDWEKEG